MSRRFLRRVLVASVLGLTGMFLIQPAASAHVSVTPDTAAPGGYTRMAFTVPNERPEASTVKLEVLLPTEHPLASVSVQPVPGWTSTAQKQKLPQPVQVEGGQVTEAVTSIVWEGGQIRPGQFEQFQVSLGRLPTGVGELVFKALQTYSDGTVVRWIDLPDAAGEAEHPAPTLSLVTPAAAPAPSSDVTARALGGGGLFAGLVALGWLLWSRSRPGTSAKVVKTSRQASNPKVGV
jgi:uncharacterized protein YcnI